MPELTIARARTLLRSRSYLVDAGVTDRQIRGLLANGMLRRVRRGWFIRSQDWKELWDEGKHLVEVVAAHGNASAPGPVFMGVSAAVLHGLPLYRSAPQHVHALIDGRRHGRTRTGIRWRESDVPSSDVTEIDGIRCTTLARTVLDCCAGMTMEGAVAVADAAQRLIAVPDGRIQNAELAEEWRRELLTRAESLSIRGITQARQAVLFADGRAQLPGESVSRLQLHRLGFRQLELQARVVGAEGDEYWLDFSFPGSQSFGEFDGMGKYTDPGFMAGRSMEEVLLAEKKREDDVRGVTGWRLGRWGSEHIVTSQQLGTRLRAFGITPP